jgi:imidazolonepropionase-like amidohydrolase
MERPYGDMRSVSLETAAALQKEGIPFAIQSGYEGYVPRTRVILFEAAIAAGNGLSFDQALAAITINASRIIGMEKHVGSLEAGKDGDAVVFDGDPFEYTSHVCTVVVNGVVMDNRCR